MIAHNRTSVAVRNLSSLTATGEPRGEATSSYTRCPFWLVPSKLFFLSRRTSFCSGRSYNPYPLFLLMSLQQRDRPVLQKFSSVRLLCAPNELLNRTVKLPASPMAPAYLIETVVFSSTPSDFADRPVCTSRGMSSVTQLRFGRGMNSTDSCSSRAIPLRENRQGLFQPYLSSSPFRDHIQAFPMMFRI